MSEWTHLTCQTCGDGFLSRTLDTSGNFCSAVCRYARPEDVAGLRERAERRRLKARAMRRMLEREIAMMAREEAGR